MHPQHAQHKCGALHVCVTINSMAVIRIATSNARMEWSPEELDALLVGPEINGFWYNSLDKLADKANELHITEGAEYDTAVHDENNPWGFDPGGYVYCVNYEARVDNYYHHTLLTVQGMAGALIEQAAREFSLGGGMTYAPSGRGSKVRGPDGRFASAGGNTVKMAKSPFKGYSRVSDIE